jgi:hypothetical protein
VRGSRRGRSARAATSLEGLIGRLLILASLLAGCAAQLRERTTPFPAGTPTAPPWELNRELLMPRPGRIRFVVDWSVGHPPEPRALAALTALAARYGERPADWSWMGTPQAPALHKRGTLLDVGHLAPGDSYVIVRYVGRALHGWGQSFDRRTDGRTLYFILINQEAHHDVAFHLLPAWRLEEQTLIHEYGHLLGLPPCDHGYFPAYPSREGGAHCVNPDCALAKPRPRALVYGLVHTLLGGRFLEDYCAACRAALAAAKLFWGRAPATSARPRSPTGSSMSSAAPPAG